MTRTKRRAQQVDISVARVTTNALLRRVGAWPPAWRSRLPRERKRSAQPRSPTSSISRRLPRGGEAAVFQFSPSQNRTILPFWSFALAPATPNHSMPFVIPSRRGYGFENSKLPRFRQRHADRQSSLDRRFWRWRAGAAVWVGLARSGKVCLAPAGVPAHRADERPKYLEEWVRKFFFLSRTSWAGLQCP